MTKSFPIKEIVIKKPRCNQNKELQRPFQHSQPSTDRSFVYSIRPSVSMVQNELTAITKLYNHQQLNQLTSFKSFYKGIENNINMSNPNEDSLEPRSSHMLARSIFRFTNAGRNYCINKTPSARHSVVGRQTPFGKT